MASHSSTIPFPVAQYFGEGSSHPVIHSTFTPGKGWTLYPMRKRITPSWGRKMKAEGITAVALTAQTPTGERTADFRIAEVARFFV